MSRRWLILADDLTGAAECAIAFARQGADARVGWGRAPPEEIPTVFAYNVDSRGLPRAQAAEQHREALQTRFSPDRLLFKKIDSTLRGSPAAELAATLDHLGDDGGHAFAILAPAFPATGRTTVGGRVFVEGHPLENTEIWRREHAYENADLVKMLADTGLQAVRIPLGAVRGPDLTESLRRLATQDETVAVCDAETDDDLLRVAKAGLGLAEPPLFVGSAGLAHALAAVGPGEPAGRPSILAPRQGGALIVVGSLASASRAAARRLVTEGRVHHLVSAPAILLAGDLNALGDEAAEVIASGRDVLVEIGVEHPGELSLGPRLAGRLAEALAPAAQRMSGFAATGGETAAILLSRFGVDGIRMVDEVEPGVALGVTLGSLSIPVVTKAGAFGDAGSLVRIARRLEAIRLKGIVS